MSGEDKLRRISRQTGIPPKQLRQLADEFSGSGLDLSKLKNSSLRDICAVKGVDAPAKATKDELVELLENA